ncbi:MAG: helix-turn-helix domain-containing protein [Rhizobacter sp.]
MSEVKSTAEASSVLRASSKSAGEMLREARQAKGLHIAALAASIKVSQRKLELLEADRISELPDATFARALAQTVCRSLKTDPTPVLAALPQAPSYRLEGVDEGINTPFRDRPGRHEPTDFSALASPAVWAPALIILAAVAVYLIPSTWVADLQAVFSGRHTALPAEPAPAPVEVTAAVEVPAVGSADAASPPALVASDPAGNASIVEQAAPAAPVVASVATPDPALSGPSLGPLQVKATQASWVEVVDSRSQVLIARMLQPGETIVLDGAMPLRLKVGNAVGTEVAFRGQLVDLATSTRDNVARLELK